jgi:transposase
MRLLRAEGYSISQIADKVGVVRSTARKYLMDAHVLYPHQKLQNQDRRLPESLRKKMREGRAEGLSNPQIAAKLGISRFTVVKYLGSGPSALRKKTPEIVARIRDLQQQGWSQKDIAAEVGVSVKSLEMWGLTNPNRPGARRMTVKDVQKMVDLYNGGLNGNEISLEMGISSTTVYKYLKEYT